MGDIKNIINNKTSLIAIMSMFYCLLQFSCHKDKESVNPCNGVSRTVAAFKSEEVYVAFSIDGGLWEYETDTISSGAAKFTVTSECDSVKWLIGSKVYRTKSVTMSFGIVMDKVLIPVTLIVFRKPRTDCFSNDKNSDTLTKAVYIAPSASKVFGSFKGYWKENPSNLFTIGLSYDSIVSNWLPLGSGPVMIQNFDKLGCFIHTNTTFGYRRAVIYNQGQGGCSEACNLYGVMTIGTDGNSVSIVYTTGGYVAGKWQTYYHTFIGERVQ